VISHNCPFLSQRARGQAWRSRWKIEPENPEILLGFGRVCLKMDLLDDAEPALAKAARLRPD